MIVLSLTKLLHYVKSSVYKRDLCFYFSLFSGTQLWITFTYGSWTIEAESCCAVLFLLKFSNIYTFVPKSISPLWEADWTLPMAETKVCSNFKEISSKILLVSVLYESHNVMCCTGWKGNGDTSKSGRIINFFPLQFPMLPDVAHERAGGRYATPSLRSTEP